MKITKGLSIGFVAALVALTFALPAEASKKLKRYQGHNAKQATLRAQNHFARKIGSRNMRIFPKFRLREHMGKERVQQIREKVGKKSKLGRELKGAELAIFDFQRGMQVERVAVIVTKGKRVGKGRYASEFLAGLVARFDEHLVGIDTLKGFGSAKKVKVGRALAEAIGLNEDPQTRLNR